VLDKPKSGEPESEIGRSKTKLGLEREAEWASRQLYFVMRIVPFPCTKGACLESYASDPKIASTGMGTRRRQVDNALVLILKSQLALQ